MNVIDFPLCLRQFFPLVFYTALMCISQVCLGRGVCKLFQKGTSANWSWCDGMEPKKLYMCGNLQQSDAQEFAV